MKFFVKFRRYNQHYVLPLKNAKFSPDQKFELSFDEGTLMLFPSDDGEVKLQRIHRVHDHEYYGVKIPSTIAEQMSQRAMLCTVQEDVIVVNQLRRFCEE